MLTREKLKRFEEFGGDLDGWTRMRRDTDESLMTVADWSLLDGLVMDLGIVESGLASAEFRAETEERLRENVSTRVKDMLKTGLSEEKQALIDKYGAALPLLKTINY